MNEIRELFKYGTSANIALVDHCASLPPDALQTPTEGTFGPVRATVTGAGRPLARTVYDYARWLASHERPHIKQIRRTLEAFG